VDGDRVARFRERVEQLRREGAYDRWRPGRVPWGEASAAVRLDGLLWAALDPGASGPPLPDAELMAEVDRHVDPAGLSPVQRDQLEDVRARFAAGALDGGEGGLSAAYDALGSVAGIEHFERGIERYKEEGRYARPANTPWADVPEAEKVHALVGLARRERPPGAYSLAAIEREVEYDRLPAGRRAALEGLRSRIDAGELEGHQPRDLGDGANYALRLAEFEQRVEDYKRDGDPWQGDIPVPWAALPEVRKLDLIVQESGAQHLHFEPRQYEVIDREVDLARVPAGRRRGIEANKERLRIGHEEYERRRQAPYEPPNEAAAAFKERIEEGLWKTGFTDGAAIFADWSDLTAQAKLHHLADVMDWEHVPESYFVTMVRREIDLAELPADLRRALEAPKANRAAFAAILEDEVPELTAGRADVPGGATEPAWPPEVRESKIRELFDTSNRVLFAEMMREKALDPAIALRPTSQVREIWMRAAEQTWDSFLEDADFRSNEEIAEALAGFQAKEAALGGNGPVTLIDGLRAAGLFGGGEEAPGADADSPPARDTTRNLVESIMLDVWPRRGAIVDFGLKSQEHYEALYYPVSEGEITAKQLDAALGKGDALTALARSARTNPHKEIAFRTDWDDLRAEPDDAPAEPARSRASGNGDIVNRAREAAGERRDNEGPEQEPGHRRDRER
jgi:hypothetical protein